MADPKNLLNDVAKLASGAVGSLVGARGEIDDLIRSRLDRVLSRLDLVSRDEFETVKAMAQKARAENEALKARLDALDVAGKSADTAAAGAHKAKTASRRKTQPKAE